MSERNYCLFCGELLPEIETVQGFSGQRGTVDCEECGAVYDLTVYVRAAPEEGDDA